MSVRQHVYWGYYLLFWMKESVLKRRAHDTISSPIKRSRRPATQAKVEYTRVAFGRRGNQKVEATIDQVDRH
jgi:hypothetical protein